MHVSSASLTPLGMEQEKAEEMRGRNDLTQPTQQKRLAGLSLRLKLTQRGTFEGHFREAFYTIGIS